MKMLSGSFVFLLVQKYKQFWEKHADCFSKMQLEDKQFVVWANEKWLQNYFNKQVRIIYA